MDNLLDIELAQELEVETENENAIDVEIEKAGPAGKDGKSAYDIYVENGGILTEEEWLNSLKGEPGDTPIKGVDYWTEEDKAIIEKDMKSYIDNQLGVIENGTY